MDGLDKFEEEYIKPLLITLNAMKSANFDLSSSDVSFLKRYWTYFYMIPMMIIHFMTITAYIVQLFTEGTDVFKNPTMIPMWLINIEYWIKMVILTKKREQIREVVINLGSMWRTSGLTEEQLTTKDMELKKLYYGGIGFIKLGLAVAWQYLMVPLCETVVRRLFLDQEFELQLPFACVYPFEITTWPVYLGVYAFQIYCIFKATYLYLGVGWLLVVLTCHLNTQFLLLQEDLINMKPEGFENRGFPPVDSEITQYWDRSEFRMEDFVRRHQDVILLTNKLNGACSKLTFTIMLFATLIISFFAIAAKASSGAVQALNNYGAIIVILMNIFILCYCSQLLSSASGGIALAAGKNLWHRGDLRYQTNIRFIIMRAQKPCSLTSLDFTPIGLETFNKVLKTTWSYFSLASQMYDRRD